MALRDSFGFLSLPRGGSEVVFQGDRRSLHERSAPTGEASTLKAWASVRLPSLDGAVDCAEQASKQLSTLKSLVRSDDPGLPQRAKLWYLASGGLAKKSAASAAQPPVSYARLAASAAELPSAAIVQLDTDVRTVGLAWRQHPMFKATQGISALSNIMVALLASNPRLQYSRQLTHMVAFTLVVFGGPSKEEQVFWTISALLEDKLFGYCQGQFQVGVRVEQEVLSRLAARKLPRLVAHLASLRLSVASFTQPWLNGLFVSHLPPETLARVWDVMMMEGPKVLLRTGLALLKMYEQTLSSCSFPEVLRKVLDLRVSRTTDAPALMAAAFRGCGSLPGGQVNTLRQEALRVVMGPNAPDAIQRSSPTPADRATSPQGPRSGDSGGGSSAPWSLFGSAGTSSRRRSSGTGSGSTTLPSSYNSGSTALAAPSSPNGSGSDREISESREASPTQVVRDSRRSRSMVSVQAMLARLVGGAKATPTSAGGVAGVAEGGMRRSATTSSVPALAAC